MKKVLFAALFSVILLILTGMPVLATEIPQAIYEQKVDRAINAMLGLQKDGQAPCFTIAEEKREIYCDTESKNGFYIYEKDSGIEVQIVKQVRRELFPNITQPYAILHGSTISRGILRRKADILLGLVFEWRTFQRTKYAAESQYRKFANIKKIVYDTIE